MAVVGSAFTVLPRRWIIERTFAWLMRSRRLARDYAARTDSSEAMVLWSMTMMMGRRLVRLVRLVRLARLAPTRQQRPRALTPAA